MSTRKTMSFQKDAATVYWGNALQVLEETIPDTSVNLIFADPPYNIGKQFAGFSDRWPSDEAYAEWCQSWIDLCIRKLTPTGSMYIMTSTQSMPYLDLYVRKRLHVLSRIVWHYDSSGVQARKLFGSMYEPILFCVKDPKNYTFNADDIKVEARTGAQRRLIDYRKPVPAMYNTHKVPGNVWCFPRCASAWRNTRSIRLRSPKPCWNASSGRAAIRATPCWTRSPGLLPHRRLPSDSAARRSASSYWEPT